MTEATDSLKALYEAHPEMTPQRHITPFEVRSAKPSVKALERGAKNGGLAASLRHRPPPTMKRFSWEDNEA